MLEEYYEFLCKRLVSWANIVQIIPGDRYVLSFEELNQVKSFMAKLADLAEVSPFVIGQGEASFDGLAITLINSQIKLVIVSTDNVTPDYLVNLRNQIGRQTGIWDNTALLFVSNRILDSINSGAKDISRQGGPFNLEELHKNLKREIRDNVQLTDKEKTLLTVMVQAFFKGEQTYTLMDFADAYAIIQKGTIEATDYTRMGYFPDRSLLTYADNEIEKRLTTNHRDFSEIGMLQGFGDTQDKIRKMVAGDSLTHDLSGNDWQKVDYKRILAGKDELSQSNQYKINYLADKIQSENELIPVWDRASKMTKAGQRNRQIIVFNPTHQNHVTVTLPFDQGVNKGGLGAASQKSQNPQVSASGHHLTVAFEDLDGQTPVAAKIVYKHQQQSALRFSFNILVLPIESADLDAIRPFYLLRIRSKGQFTIQLPSDIDAFQVGSFQRATEVQAQSVADLNNLETTKWRSFLIKTNDLTLHDDNEDLFTIKVTGVPVNFSFIDEEERIVPRDAVYMENYRRQHQLDGHYRNKQVSFGESAFSVYDTQKVYLEAENQSIQSDSLFVDYTDFQISTALKQRYFDLFSQLRHRNTLMSLVNWDLEIRQEVEAIVDQVQLEISQAEDRIELTPEVRNIVHIGEFNLDGDISYAPFNPLLLRYQLQVETQVETEELSDTIQRKLNPLHLVPYLKRDNQSYKANYVSNAPRWLIYSLSTLAKFSEFSQKIITERLKDFRKHFGYLFSSNANNPYNIRAVHVNDEKPLIKSVTDYLIYEITQHKQNLEEINPVNLYIINQQQGTISPIISRFYKVSGRTEYEDFFNVPLKSIPDVTPDQVLEVIQQKLNVFYGANTQIDFHVTFYQFANQLTLGQYSTEKLAMNYSIDGLLGGEEYTNVQDSIKSGFGIRGLQSDQDNVLTLAQSWNDLLVATAKRHGVMAHGQTLTNNIEELDSVDFLQQFDSSKWVTLLNPEVKLDYFNRMDSGIYVIHYTDYTNSANYESITLTKQVKEYETILSENLPEAVANRQDTQFLTTIIKSFNIINGEWLLRLVSHRNQKNTVKEKLSILAVYKEMLGILHVSKVIWVPLSLEEILRVSGSFVGESRNDAIFSAKSLGAKGKISDDLLFIGLWQDQGHLKVTFLPTEVKVGQNANSVIDKATSQVEKTYRVLQQTIFDVDNFKSKFYLDFFMKLYFANAAKMYSNNSLDQETYDLLQKERQSVIQGMVTVDNTLTDDYQNKFVFSLKADESTRLIRITNDYAMVEVPENDAYHISGVKTQQVIDQIQTQKFGFDASRTLANQMPSVSNEKESVAEKAAATTSDTSEPMTVTENQQTKSIQLNSEPVESPTEYQYAAELQSATTQTTRDDESEDVSGTTDATHEARHRLQIAESTPSMAAQTSTSSNQEVSIENDTSSANRRLLLGTIDGSTTQAYWEYDNPQLANRHMLITGKSGQGKTYFMQTLLLEFAQQKIDTLILDYTDSYLPGQLDPLLEQQVSNIQQHIVMQEHLAINPFKYNQYSIGTDFTYQETAKDVVSRVAEVLDFVFTLGIQQKSRLITIMNEGMVVHPQYTFSILREQLLKNKDDITLYGRLQPLLDQDPFTYGKAAFDWADYFGNQGQINIIQLSRFPASVKNTMIEFVLWDLFNYSQMHTDRHLVYPVFLDEVQNLNFSRETPTFKILTEGRKFGWSGIFATQSLSSIKGEVDAIYNTAEQVHFLPPESQTRAIARTLSSDRNQQKQYEQELSQLQKGHCIVNGPALDSQSRLSKRADLIRVNSLEERIAHE